MADAALEFLLNNLKELLLYHSKLITETRSQIESLDKDLRVFKAFLKDSVKKRREDETTKALVQNIRDVVYEVEDVVDLFVTKALEKNAKKNYLKFWQRPQNLHTIGGKVEEVKRKVERARIDFANLRIDHEDRSDKPQAWPLRERDVVGFVDVTEGLIKQLTQKTDYFDVVSLTGMFGLGKTTVARKIFNDPAIIYEFPVRIWLYISQEFSNKDVFLAILKEFTNINEKIREKNEQELGRDVAARLEEVCFLMVMDDIWNRADWDRLRVVLPKNNNKCKILITSRNEDVGVYVSCPRAPHKLRHFTQEESWELLRLEALRSLDCPPILLGVGQIIAKDCNGLPLSVVVIGGILATRYSASDMNLTKKEWDEVSTRVSSFLKEDPANRVNKFISLSYDRLPYHLRACFLYLGMFPEDYEIPVSRLTRMWIGEGFIQQSDDSSLEETAVKYLKDLINRNLVTIDKIKPDGKAKTCRIHDTLHEFCRIEAGNENENFFQEIKSRNGSFAPNSYEYRRISIHSNCLGFISSKPVGDRVRSFVCFSKDGFTLAQDKIPHILGAFKLLRVLDAKPIKLLKITKHMYELVHVRYIALSLVNMSSLPKYFSELWNIQTLIIDTTCRELAVKADIWKLPRLRHFKTNASATLPEPDKDSTHGVELQTLSKISVKNCTTKIFGRACNLKKLGIRGELGVDGRIESFDAIGKLKYLEKLKLMNDVYLRPASDGRLRCLPQPYQFPSTLKSLTLVSTSLEWEHMQILGLLDKLEILKLKDNAFTGDRWNAVDGGFRHLEFLQIKNTDLKCWEASSHHFPRLRSLMLENCEKLIEIPISLADVETLQMLELSVCKSAAASAKRIQEKKKTTHNQGSTFKLSIFPPE